MALSVKDLDFDLALQCMALGSQDLVDELAANLNVPGAKIHIERRAQAYGGVEWLLPTAAVLFVMSRYFGSMLEEAGKEHYPQLRTAVVRLLRRLNQLPLRRVSSVSGKVSSDRPGAFSVYYVLEPCHTLKYVFDPDTDEAKNDLALSALFSQLEEVTRLSTAEREDLITSLSWQVVFRFDPSARRWRAWDGMEERFRD